MQKILVIQTAFIGDVVLATGILEKLHKTYPKSAIDFLVRKGNESLFINHPFLNNVLVWNKKSNKLINLFKLLLEIRGNKYDTVINVQRFAATGLLTIFSGVKLTIGFNKNPFSFLFHQKIKHVISSEKNPIHEVERNQQLISKITTGEASLPKLYPSEQDYFFVKKYKASKYICLAPASVWFTKQFPVNKWVELINHLPENLDIYLIGGPSDVELCETIISSINNKHNCINLSGKLSFLQSAALQQDAVMNFVNDSAPMHFASAVNAAVTAIYCSTLPSFGFGPLSTNKNIVESKEKLMCKPCGLHGKKSCKETHFNCANSIKVNDLINTINTTPLA